MALGVAEPPVVFGLPPLELGLPPAARAPPEPEPGAPSAPQATPESKHTSAVAVSDVNAVIGSLADGGNSTGGKTSRTQARISVRAWFGIPR